MLLRIPVAATNLILSQARTRSKLTATAVKEFVALAAHDEVLCLSSPPTSGVDSPFNSGGKRTKAKKVS